MKVKPYANTYIYGKTSAYEKNIMDFIMKADRINTSDKKFEDIKYQVKTRQISNKLYQLLDKEYIVLLNGGTVGLPKVFKVFTARDLRLDNKKLKIFIDCTDILIETETGYKINNIDILISYLLTASVNHIYYNNSKTVIMNNKLKQEGAEAFSYLFTHIINYIYKINLMESKRDTCMYLASLYYLENILGNLDRSGNSSIAKKISRISDRQIEILDIHLDKDSFTNIKTFIDTISGILKLTGLTIDVFIEKWIYLYGTGTHLATEYFPSFSSMMTDTYIGSYINNQHSIEKTTGKSMVHFTKEIIRITEMSDN